MCIFIAQMTFYYFYYLLLATVRVVHKCSSDEKNTLINISGKHKNTVSQSFAIMYVIDLWGYKVF